MSIGPDDELRLAMQKMNETGWTFVLVVEDDRLIGVLADGDIRRYLARGGAVDAAAREAINATPTTVSSEMPANDVRSLMTRRGFEYLPALAGESVETLHILERGPRQSEMSAVLLVGGLGSRLAPLTDNCPKPLLPLGDRPVLSHILDHLQGQGVSRFVLAVNYLSHMIVDYYGDGTQRDCFVDYVHETKRLGTGGPLSLVDPEALSDPFLCMNGDILNDLDVGSLRETHESRGWDATMVVREHHYTVPYGVVETDDAGGLVAMTEKPVQSFQINTGMYMLSKSALQVVPAGCEYDLPTLFDEAPARGLQTGTHAHDGRWMDIGTVDEYQRAQSALDGAQS